MKKLFTILFFATFSFANAQAYKGKGDTKGQIGLNVQSGGTGIFASTDFGIAQNISYGFTANYILSNSEFYGNTPKLGDRIDLKLRFNANLGDVFQLDEKMDIYPGLDLGTRNFGAHIGFRYFFTDGFGVFSEFNTPISKYNIDAEGLHLFNNQFTFNIGASFNL